MTTRTLFALLLVAIGMTIALYGLGGALAQLIGLYQGALSDPLGQPDNAEKVASAKMIHSVIVGLFGIPPLLIGTVLLKIGMYRALKRRGGW